MPTLSGFPSIEMEFDRAGRHSDPEQADALHTALRSGRHERLIVVAHGWNNDMAQARRLVARLMASLGDVTRSGPLALDPASTLVLTVLWPAKKFADQDLIASGAASLDDAGLLTDLDQLAELFDDEPSRARLAEAKALLPDLDGDEEARGRFADVVRSLLTPDDLDPDDASRQFFAQPGEQLLQRLAQAASSLDVDLEDSDGDGDGPIGLDVPSGGTQADTGSAAGLGHLLGRMREGARDLLNYTTYYEMKRRAGVVGEALGTGVLRPLLGEHTGLPVHLVGHSFGGRLATAAALGAGRGTDRHVRSLVLLQAAFSHYAFGRDIDPGRNGTFRAVVADTLVDGPILVTHTRNDEAVGRAYPIASLIAGHDSAERGDENDRYGGIGRNGAQKTPEAVQGELLEVGGTYQHDDGGVWNLLADRWISSHGDVTGRQVAHAIATAVARGGA